MDVNLLAVLVAAVLSMPLGFLWYGPLFGKKWIELTNFNAADMDNATKSGMAKNYTLSFIASLITAKVLAFFFNWLGVSGICEGLWYGFLFWLGFVATIKFNDMLFGKDKSFHLFLINSGYYLASILLMSAVLAVWF